MPSVGRRRARGALVDRAWRRARRRGGARRPRLRPRLRSQGLGRRAAMPLAGRRPRLMAIHLSDPREAEPRHVAHRPRRHRQVRRGHRAEVRRVVSRSRDGPRVLADRHGSAVRRDGAAVVRRPVPAGRSRARNSRPRRQFALAGARLPLGQDRLEEPQPARLDDDPFVDRADGVRRQADVRLLRQGGRRRRLGRRRLDPLGHDRLENQHRHRPLAGDSARRHGSFSPADTTRGR